MDRFVFQRTPAELVALLTPELGRRGYRLTSQSDQLATFHKAKKTVLTGGIVGALASTDRTVTLSFSEPNAEGARYMQAEYADRRIERYFDQLAEFRA